MKSNRNFPRGEPRRFGNVALIALMLGSLLVLCLIRARLTPIGKAGDDRKLEEQKLMSKAGVKMKTIDTAGDSTAANVEKREDEALSKPADTTFGAAAAANADMSKPVCYESSRRSDTCEAAGDVRVQGNTQTIYVHPLQQEWRTKPYCRKHDSFALSHVKEWALKPLPAAPPQCTLNSTATGFVLSTGGFTGNLFHDYTDVLIPAFITAYRFAGEVQFLVSSFKSWWMNRFLQIFQQLSKHEIIDIDSDEEVRCFRSIVVGPTFHRELGVDASKTPSGYSVMDFRKMLRKAFGLERVAAAPTGDQWDIRRKPRLLIISRRRSRAFLNARAMVDMATSLGFDVRIGEPDVTTDVSKFARLVNSADVMVGAHGEGLTNMVFLPAGAVLIQVVPYGRLEWLARGTFKEPSADMEIHYLEYMIQLDETTLSDQYPKDHPVLKDPYSIHTQGWDALKTVYLDKQNLRPHLGRLKNTFIEALKLLPHGRRN